MNIGDLYAQLSKLISMGFKDATVVFEVENPVEGGIMARSFDGKAILNLTPIKLDQVGGF